MLKHSWYSDRESEGLWEPFDPEVLARSTHMLTKHDLGDIDDLAFDNDRPKVEVGVSEDELASKLRRAEQHRDQFDQWRWTKIRDAIYPEPKPFREVNYACKERLQDLWADSGLQVIVKIAQIELTPDKPAFPAGGWHLEGMMNERICATALYYVDSANITPSSLVFRTETDRDPDYIIDSTGQDVFQLVGANLWR